MNKQVVTFGCRLNSVESEIIKDHLASMPESEVVVFNTCSVTKEAERQAKQAIRRYKREHPEAKIIVTGCAAQISPENYAAIEGVDAVLGNEEKLHAESYTALLGEKTPDDSAILRVNDIMSVQETAPQLISGIENRARAFMQIQNGCNHRCTFCIIPYGRGNSRSIPMGELVAQGKLLVEQGFNEIVLTGVDVTSYGEDLPGKPRLGEMVRRFLTLVPQLPRLRLSSIDVAEIDDVLMDLLLHEPRLMPHLHLSLQAGDNMILKRMKRRHTREQAIDFAQKVTAIRPDIVFGADIIAGFPTESDEMFGNGLRMVEQINIPHLHVFPYSEREGTPAASIPASKQVPVPVRKERAKILRECASDALDRLTASRDGETERVIVESQSIGRTEQFLEVSLKGDYAPGNLVELDVALEDGRLVER